MAYITNRFCWHGLMTTDTAKAGAFYAEVIGWKSQSMTMGDQESLMFIAHDVPVAHYMDVPTKEVPTHWNNYLRVDDVDASTKAAVDAGGCVVAEAIDIPPGRFSVVGSPSGATISLFHEADEATAEHHPGGMGGVHWTELHSTDIDADMAWIKTVFGFDIGEMPMPQGGTYYMLNVGEDKRGGASPSFMKDAPSMWLTWFSVDNCDDALKRVEGNQGKVLSPAMDMPGVGRMAIIMDNTGGVCGLIQPATDS